MSKLCKKNWFKPVFLITLALVTIAVVVVLALPEKEVEADIVSNNMMQTPESTSVIELKNDEELTEIDESGVDGVGIEETKDSLDDDYAQTDEVDEEIAKEDGRVPEETEEITLNSNNNDNSGDTSNTEETTSNSNNNDNSSDTEENTSDANGDENSNDGSDTQENDTESSNTAVLGGNPWSGDIDTSGLDPNAIAMYKDPDHEEDDPPQIVGKKWVNGTAVPMTVAEVEEHLKQIYATQTLEDYRALKDSVVYFNIGIDTTRLIWNEDYAG